MSVTNDNKQAPMEFDCTHFEETLADLDRPGTAGASLREAALAHAESCGRCAALLTESESLDFTLHSLAAHDAFRTASPRLEVALVNRFRLEKGIAARRRMQWQISLLGAAAAMLLVLGFAFHKTQPSGVQPQTQSAGLAEGSQAASDDGSSAMAADYADADDEGRPFTRLPYADDADADGDTIVRVVLSRSALASLGMSDAALTASDQVSADLIVSQDGTPQAIRLLEQENQNE